MQSLLDVHAGIDYKNEVAKELDNSRCKSFVR